jgi:hypothetical protein
LHDHLMRNVAVASRRSLAGFAAALASLMIIGALAGTASARPFYYIVNSNSGKVLQAENHSKAWGTRVVQENIGPYGAQHWFIKNEGVYAGLTLRSFENRNAHLCIHPSDWSGTPGTDLLLASCSNDSSWAARSWAPTYTSGNYDPLGIFYNREFSMFNRQSFKYAAIAYASQSVGERAVQANWEDNPHFHWRLIYGGESG